MPKNQPLTNQQLPITNLLNDDLQFLVSCCQRVLSEENKVFILSYINAEDLEINALSSLANQHGILPLIYKTIKKIVDEDHSRSSLNTQHLAPSTLLAELKTKYMVISQRNMLMSAELIRIMKLLRENSIEALAFKGPVLGEMAYEDITLRQYSDLDILVSETEVSKAGSVLEKHGYTPLFSISILENKTCLEVTNDLGFTNDKNGTLVELHWKLFREKIGQHLHFSQISGNRQSVKINGKTIPTLSTEMLLVYLCLHGSKHAWERVEWIFDIDKLICSNENIDWDKVLSIAKEMDTNTSLSLGLRLSHILFHTPLPVHIVLMTENDRINDLMMKTYTMLNSTLSETEGYNKYNAIHMYQMDLLDTKLKKLKHLSATYFGISRNDCQSCPLPPSLKFLYIFIKPLRVIGKYIQYGK